MNKKIKNLFKKATTVFLMFSTILFSSGFLFFTWHIPNAKAAVQILVQPTELITVSQKAKASSANIAVAKFALATTSPEYLASVSVIIATTTNSGMTASDLATLKVWKDLSGDESLGAGDEVATSTSIINLGSATTLSAFPLTATSSIGTATTTFFISISTASTWSDNGIGVDDSISVSIPANSGITTTMGGNTGNSALNGANALSADTTAPSVNVSQSGPPDGATGVPIQCQPHISFSETMPAGSLTTSNILLQAGGAGANLCASINVQSMGADCVISSSLATSTSYTLKVASTTVDSASNGLSGGDWTATFTTGTTGTTNITPPVITSTYPVTGATSIATNAKLKVYFSHDMAITGNGSVTSTANILLQTEQYGQPTGSNLLTSNSNLSWSSTFEELTIAPPSALNVNASYILKVRNTVNSSQNIPFGGPDYMVFFQTGASTDTTGPSVSAIVPANAATSVVRNTSDIVISFNEGLDYSTISTSTVRFMRDDNGDSAANDTPFATSTVVYNPGEKAVHLSPNVILQKNSKYLVLIISGASGVKDVVGNEMAADVTKSFTTVNTDYSDSVKPTVLFANADNFGLAITFSEPVKSDGGANAANNLDNYTLESPVGTTISLSGKTISYDGAKNTVLIGGLALSVSSAFKVTVSTNVQDLVSNAVDSTGSPAGNVAQGTVQNSTNTGGQLGPGSQVGPVNYFNMGTSPIAVMPRSAMAGATSNYKVEFPITAAIPLGGKILLTFPAGFNMANATTVPAATSLENQDINGPNTGTVGINESLGGGNAAANTVTVYTKTAATQATDMIRFELQGIVNSSTPRDFTTSGYTVDIKTFNTSGVLLESMVSMPFFLSTPGNYAVSGYVFNDADADGTKDGGESGIQNIKVCLGGPMVGFSCQNSGADGSYSFTQLGNGPYNLNIPPLATGNYVGGPFFRDIMISGANQENVNFALQSTNSTISVSITGGPANAKLDIMAFNSSDMTMGGNIVRETTLNGSGATASAVQLPVMTGKWQVAVGPWMPKDPSMGPQAPPDFTFMPPKPQEVNVATAGDYPATFTLKAANRSIIGKVVDGSGTAIPNAFVMARPTMTFTGSGTTMEANAGATMTKPDGTFVMKVVNGIYQVDAAMPGMPPSAAVEITVKDNATAGDGNNDGTYGADVYSNGTLLTGLGLTIKIAKGDYSISGQVLDESGNAIAYAHVGADKIDSGGGFMGGHTDAPTDASGNYTLYVSNGTWRVKAFAPNYGEITSTTVTVSGASLSGKNLQATTADFGTVSGNVKVGGTNQAGAFVTIYGSSGSNQGITDTSGNYSMKIKAGTGYTIEGFVPNKGSLTPLTNVTITAGGTTANQNLTVDAPGTISVTITGITDAFVDARAANGRGMGTGSNTSGVYSITLPPGTYTVKAQNPKYGVLGTQTGVVVTSNNTTSITFTAPNLYAVSGTITSSSSVCKEGATVFLTDTANGRFIVTTTDNTGAWSINLPNGTYYLSAGKPGCIDSASPTTVTISGAALSTGTGRILTAADVTLSGRVTLSGSNVTNEGKVVADNGAGIIVVVSIDTTVTGTTNNYTLYLSAGTWSIRAYTDGYESSAISRTVTSGQTSASGNDLTLAARAGYTIRESRSMSMTPAQGGIIKNTDIGSSFEINIPAGALGSSTDDGSVATKEKTSVASTANARVVGGKGFEITPKDASGQPIKSVSSSSGTGVTVTVPYAESDVTALGISESQLVLGHWSEDQQQWESLSTVVDTVNNALTATITEFSDFAPIAPTAAGTPSAPAGLSATGGDRQVVLTWTASTGATSYNLYRDDNYSSSFPRVGTEPTTTSTSYTDTNLGSGVTYYYKVSARNANGESAASAYVQVRTSGGAGGSSGSSSSSGSTPTTTTTTTTTQTQTQTQTQASAPTTSVALPSSLKEGYIVKSITDNALYLIRGNKKIAIPTMSVFNSAGLKTSSIKTVPASDIAAAASTSLIKSSEDNKVYLIKGNKKLIVPSASGFETAGFKWADIVSVAKKEKEAFVEANLIKSTDSDKVYIIDKGLTRHIPNASVFESYKYKWSEIVIVTPTELGMYGQAMLLKAAGDAKVYIIENGVKRWIPSASIFVTKGYDWNNIVKTNATELNSYATGANIQ